MKNIKITIKNSCHNLIKNFILFKKKINLMSILSNKVINSIKYIYIYINELYNILIIFYYLNYTKIKVNLIHLFIYFLYFYFFFFFFANHNIYFIIDIYYIFTLICL